jgi:hypothetical protein
MRFPFDFQIVNGLPRFRAPKPVATLNQVRGIYRPTFGANIVLDMSLGDMPMIVATGAGAFTIANPLNDPGEACELTIVIANASGGALGAVTFGTKFHTAAGIAFPANNQTRIYEFYKINGTAGAGDTWQQSSATADTPTPN